MAKLIISSSIVFAGALIACFLGIAQSAEPQFFVEGKVFCEVCRTNFINKFSEPMPGAKVRLECKNSIDKKVTYSVDGVTGADGMYKVAVSGDHDDEVCEVTLLQSGRADCAEIPDEGIWAEKPSSKVTLTENNGFHGSTRLANPLSFTKKASAPQCVEIFKEIQAEEDDN